MSSSDDLGLRNPTRHSYYKSPKNCHEPLLYRSTRLRSPAGKKKRAKFKDFFRVMNRPAGRCRRLSKSRGTSAVGSGGVPKSHRSGRDWVRRLSNVMGRAVSGRVGPGHPDTIRPTRNNLTREKTCKKNCSPYRSTLQFHVTPKTLDTLDEKYVWYLKRLLPEF